ncbi:MarR family winged helix-turn-helix transcriptional regulator [Curvivirga sp.]|uniref:MarR family winged helix-turn-helix transcriptional regulator n=1 Tax=Curvivirga sp. TaxID=2856848 RepID=UPI003B594B5F
MARSYTRVLLAIEKDLKAAGFPALDWYDILLELEKAGEEGLRPFELQEKLLLPQYGVSRLVSRIEKEGYVERVSCTEDGRGQSLKITSLGKDLREKMWAIYGPSLEKNLGAKISEDQVKMIADILRKI